MKKERIKQIWKDPVLSKVIAAGLIFVLSQFFILLWGLIKNLNFIEVYRNLFNLLNAYYQVNGWIIFFVVFLVVLDIIHFLKRRRYKNSSIETNKLITQEETKVAIYDAPTVFFHNRFREAFPGFSRDYQWFKSNKDINTRLKLLLSEPTSFDVGKGHGIDTKPIWWFRGGSALPIENFKVLDKKKILINYDEFIVDKVAAYRGRSYFQDFVYIQCLPDVPTGLYEHNQITIEECYNNNYEYQEEFGLYKNRFITSQEYDDGSAIINGKPIKVIESELRSRTLTKYNFIISAKYSPYNCKEFCQYSLDYFGKLLKDEIQFDEFVLWMKNLPKNPHDD